MKLPVVLLTGFLGAGKTTLLRRILADAGELRIGVLLNEIGVAGIDSVFALAFKELADACACCVRTDDFEAAVEQMATRGDLDLLVLETTGTADPLPIMWRLEHIASVTLECVVTVVDPTTQEAFGRDEWIAQVQAADWIVLTKRDLPGDREVCMKAVREVQRDARFIDGNTVAETITTRGGDLTVRELPAFAVARHTKLHGVVITQSGLFSAERVETLFEGLPAHIVRAKAIVHTNEGWMSIHRVGARLHFEVDKTAPAHRESRFAFFSETPDEVGLTSSIASAKLAGE